jgi:hypothetical protein
MKTIYGIVFRISIFFAFFSVIIAEEIIGEGGCNEPTNRCKLHRTNRVTMECIEILLECDPQDGAHAWCDPVDGLCMYTDCDPATPGCMYNERVKKSRWNYVERKEEPKTTSQKQSKGNVFYIIKQWLFGN